MKKIRYCIQLSTCRTTVSIDRVISDLLAIKLGFNPNTKKAYQAIKIRLNELIIDRSRSKHGLSAYVTQEAILDLIYKSLSNKYYDYLLEQ